MFHREGILVLAALEGDTSFFVYKNVDHCSFDLFIIGRKERMVDKACCDSDVMGVCQYSSVTDGTDRWRHLPE